LKILYFSRDYTTHDRRFLEALVKSGYDVFFLRFENSEHSFEERPLPQGVQPVEWVPDSNVFTQQIEPLLSLVEKMEQKQAEPSISLPDKEIGTEYLPGEIHSLLDPFKDILEEIKPDLIQAGPIHSCALLASLAGFHPLVSTSWGSDLLVDADRDERMRKITRYVLSHSDALIGDCDPVRKKAAEFGMPDEKIITFPWGIDLRQFKAQPYPQTPRGHFRLLSTRTWEPIYGVDLILQAFARVVRSYENGSLEKNLKPELVLLGNGSQEPQIKDLIRQEGLDEFIFLPGRIRQDELPDLYASADLYISASHSDGTSISLLEAMGSARAVLVTDIPGNREWITHGVEGWLFPDGNTFALAEGILNALHQYHRLPEMGMAARKKTELHADWQKNYPRLFDAYEIASRGI
jgi:L-malate glycosyltransferase